MFESIGLFLLGLALLALGGDSIVKGASGLGRHFGLTPFATGLLLVAFGTSIPELAINARAVWMDQQALALGNAVGSNLANFGLTLGDRLLTNEARRLAEPRLAYMRGFLEQLRSELPPGTEP